MKLLDSGNRRTFIGTLVGFLVMLGVANMTYYNEKLLPVLSPLVSEKRGAIFSLQQQDAGNEGTPVFSINDNTIPWPDWSPKTFQQDHPAQILLTNYGWNHPNQTIGLTHARTIRSSGLLRGILAHPWFRPVSWDEVSTQTPNITTYVFLDVETCFESNWPHYYEGGPNVDVINNRSTELQRFGQCCSFQNQALAQPIFQSPNTRLVLFDCSGFGTRYCCLRNRNKTATSVVSYSAPVFKHTVNDLGLPPPAGHPVNLTHQQKNDILQCDDKSRTLLYTFAGVFARGDLRPHLQKFHDGKDVLVVKTTQEANMTYEEFMLKSKFAGTPKGDNLFSYRFAEAMSAGAIPVVHADNWVLPFSNDLIDWKKCIVIIPESQVNETITILSNISDEERCEMRKCVLHAYQRFMSTPERTVDGIVQSLELRKTHPPDSLDTRLAKTFQRYKRQEMPHDSTTNQAESVASSKPQDTSPLAEHPSFSFNDKTIQWPEAWQSLSPTLDNSDAPGQILLTNYGWNHPNQTKGLSFARSIRQTRLLEATIKHPWFRPVSWDEVSSKPTNIPTYVFLDVEMCFEYNWPHYGGGGEGLNVDKNFNRTEAIERSSCCSFQDKALKQPIFQSPHVRLILFDCSGDGLRYCCLKDRNINSTNVVSYSATKFQLSEHDLGMPPPAGNPIKMNGQQIKDIVTCNDTSRPLLYTFAGTFARGNLRPKLPALHNGKDVLVVKNTKDVGMTYDDFLLQSKFTGTPRGDDLFSYRFTEAMSAGAIPVIHADDWVLPFTKDLINWSKCAVVIPEAQVNNTISILSKITPEQQCEMRKCVLSAYRMYMMNSDREIAGIIQSLELMRRNGGRMRKMRRLLRHHR